MNLKRGILYGLLVFVVILLWNAWQHDHPQIENNQPVAENNTIVSNNITNNPAAYSNNASNASTQAAIPSNRIVKVHTDSLDMSIDTLGGEINYVDLPQYPVSLHSTQPYVLVDANSDDQYSIQSGLSGISQQALQYSASQASYTLDKNEKELKVVLQATTENNVQVAKIFTFYPNSYVVKVSYNLTNNGSQIQTGSSFMQVTRNNVPPVGDGAFNIHSFYGFAMYSPQNHYQDFKLASLNDKPISQNVRGGWLAMTQHYFLSAWVPHSGLTYQYYSHVNNGLYTIGAQSQSFTLAPKQSIEISSKLYSGPKLDNQLDALAPHLSMTINYGWLWPISIGIFWLMKHIYQVVGNWGWAIVIVTLLIKLVFWKLSEKSYYSMAAMRTLQPKIQALKERCGDDKQQFSREMMGLYKKEKINPIGGCLPMLIQIPFFIALYWVLMASVQLRQAPFIFWIHDLAAKDPYFILPVLMGLSMFFMQKMNPPPPDPVQAKVFMFLPVIITVVFLKLPAGLILYMLVNNLVSIGQQVWVLKKYQSKVKDEGQDKKDWDKRKKQNNKK